MNTVLVECREAVATVTINRPERRNSLIADVKVALRDALRDIAADASVRAVVLTGAGEHFCAGQDLKEHAEVIAAAPENAFDTVAEHYAPITRTLATMPKPVIAAVEGTCVGAGLGFALACDLRVFATSAVLATAFTGIGLTCDSGLAYTLPHAVGAARARELVLLGDSFTPEQANAWGIAGRIVEHGEALAQAQALAARLAQGPTAAYAETKYLISQAVSLEQTLAEEGHAQARLGLSSDHPAAVKAFLSKQTPTFVGH